GGRSQAFPPNLPELESRLWANQNFIDSEEHLRKIVDGLAVIFNSNFEGSLTFSCSSSARRETENQNQEQDPAADAGHYRFAESRKAISLRISFSCHLSV